MCLYFSPSSYKRIKQYRTSRSVNPVDQQDVRERVHVRVHVYVHESSKFYYQALISGHKRTLVILGRLLQSEGHNNYAS